MEAKNKSLWKFACALGGWFFGFVGEEMMKHRISCILCALAIYITFFQYDSTVIFVQEISVGVARAVIRASGSHSELPALDKD